MGWETPQRECHIAVAQVVCVDNQALNVIPSGNIFLSLLQRTRTSLNWLPRQSPSAE